MRIPDDVQPIAGVQPPSYTEASLWPGAHTRRVPDGFVVLHGQREIWFDINGRYNHHMYHGPLTTTPHLWTGAPRNGVTNTPRAHGITDVPRNSKALDEWNKKHGGTGQAEEVSPHIYRGHSWAWAVNEIHQDRWGSFIAKMADGAEINASTFATLMDTITKNYPESMRRDEMARYSINDGYDDGYDDLVRRYIDPPQWVTTTYEKQRRAAEKRKRDQFGRFLPEDEPELDYKEHVARDRERSRIARAKRLADQMIPSHEHPDNMRNILKHVDPGPKKIRFNSGGRGQTDDQLERWTVRVSLGGKNMTDFAQELRLSKFGLYADLKAYDTQADEWDVTIRGGKDAFDRWFAEMRKEK